MHRLASSFVLGYHGCDRSVGEKLLSGAPFRTSDNDYDWLGPGIYFWEANPERALDFAGELAGLRKPRISVPFVVGAIIEMGLCLDLAAKDSIEQVQIAHGDLSETAKREGTLLPKNGKLVWQHDLDCAVIRHLHQMVAEAESESIDTIRGLFIEGSPLYEQSGFWSKNHVQIAVCNPTCIKGVFRVPYPTKKPSRKRRTA